MKVRRIGYLGTRTQNVDGMTWFLRDVLGLEAVGDGETVTFQRLPTHPLDLVEVFAQEHHDIRMIPDECDFVIGFVVDDLRQAMAEVKAAGLKLVNESVWAADAFDNPEYGEMAWFWELEELNPYSVQFRYENLGAIPDFAPEHAELLARRAFDWARLELGWTDEESGDTDNDADNDADNPPDSELALGTSASEHDVDPELPF